MPRRVLGFAVLALVALGACAWWFYLRRTSPDLASPSHVQWFGLDGEAIPNGGQLFESCGSDFGFDSLSFGGALWGSCTMTMNPSDGLVRIDPVRGRGQYYPVPEDLAYAGTYGLIPNEDGRLGVVYAAQAIGETMAVGIVDPSGWVISPRPVSENRMESYAGAAWVDGELEVALLDGETAVVVRVVDGTLQRRPLDLRCEEASCRLSRVALRRDGEWRFVASVDGEVVEFDEAGRQNESPWDAPSARLITENVDNVANGVVSVGNFVALREEGNLGTIQPDGSLARLASVPPSWTLAMFSRLVFDDGSLVRTPMAFAGSALAQRIEDRWVATGADGQTIMRLDFDAEGQARDRRPVGDLRGSGCPSLMSGTVMREQGTLWLVHPSGCYLSLGNEEAH